MCFGIASENGVVMETFDISMQVQEAHTPPVIADALDWKYNLAMLFIKSTASVINLKLDKDLAHPTLLAELKRPVI